MPSSAALAFAAGWLLLAPASPAGTPKDAPWVDTWAASPDSDAASIAGHAVREIVRTSVGGTRVRVRLSNLFGSGPITLGPVHVAAHAQGSAIVPGTDHALTFGGKSTVTISKGAEVLSDPAAMAVKPLEELAVSLFVPVGAGASTVHGDGVQTAYLSPSPDATGATAFPASTTASSRFFLTDVQVAAEANARGIVAFGDSITDGHVSTRDRNARWPDALAERLQADPSLASVAVANEGISGNRLLHDGAGLSALARFDRDALDKPGVRWVLLMEGINDIGETDAPDTPADENVSAQQVIDGLKQLIARAHAKGVAMGGATLTPFRGTTILLYSDASEAKRQAVNAWIRNSGAFDAVIDFDRVLRDPGHPDRFLPSFDSGDHLHPNDAGYKAMAAAIDLRLFAKRAASAVSSR